MTDLTRPALADCAAPPQGRTGSSTARPTLEDVAAVAGVSAKTVSNVLRDKPGASPSTQARVRTAAASLGYRVGAAGAVLAQGRTQRVAIVVPMLYQSYFAQMVELILTELRQNHYFSTLRIAPQPADVASAILDTADVDGVIVLPHLDVDTLMAQSEFSRPTVLIGGRPSTACDCVVMGDRKGISAVARHLLLTGHSRVAFVWNEPAIQPDEDYRLMTAIETLREHGIATSPELVAYGSEWDRRMSGYEATLTLLRGGASFDALMCVNDALAVGALRALRLFGLSVPGDVAVTGFDDTLEGKFTSPALTSVNPRKSEMVHHAVRMLLQRVKGYDGPPRHVTTDADLVVRASAPS
ncbi:MAG: LacI family transcriptional regulator [Propionibacteriaceae bacterium]|jgi:DNA-binding LacI/PurR family transcriptional regulator|nr:LacI family transcriptional regulator [Propionibacteriaceae bacterium]